MLAQLASNWKPSRSLSGFVSNRATKRAPPYLSFRCRTATRLLLGIAARSGNNQPASKCGIPTRAGIHDVSMGVYQNKRCKSDSGIGNNPQGKASKIGRDTRSGVKTGSSKCHKAATFSFPTPRLQHSFMDIGGVYPTLSTMRWIAGLARGHGPGTRFGMFDLNTRRHLRVGLARRGMLLLLRVLEVTPPIAFTGTACE